ncbi:MAG TPA: amino acid adenylation domain-containing protein, partial [Steroidobacteraceae bacterium]
RLPRKNSSTVSFGQQRLWFLAQLEGPSAAYNVSSAFCFTGPLDVERLRLAISAIVHRHEILRTSFPTVGGSPVQSIAPPAPVSLEVIAAPTQTRALELAAERSAAPFDLATGPLFRIALYRIDASHHVLWVVLHHIICDAWSARVLREELIALYQQQSLPALDIQYADYAAWQRQHLSTTSARDQLGRLSAALRDAPEFLELPTDQPRPALQTFNGAALPFNLDEHLTRTLRALGRQSDVTTFMILLAGYAALLSRYSRQKDLVIGSPIANRSRRETEPLIGFFVNTLALRIDLTGHPSLRELLARVKRVALESYATQDIPFEQIVDAVSPERSLSLSPIFQVMFSYETDLANATSFADLEVRSLPLRIQTAKFDLTLYIEDRPDGISGSLEYNTDLFSGETAARMVNHYLNLLRAMIAQPEAPVERLPLLSALEHQRLTVEWNATDSEYPATPIHILFEQQVELHPDLVAVVYEDTSLKYRELNARANQLAHQLIGLGVTSDSLVCICMERSLEMIVGLLAILKAGGAYVPIDPEYPTERVRFMLENSRSRWLLTQPHLIERLPAAQARTVLVTAAATDEATLPVANPSSRVAPGNLAYMIYTSGSTGLPKGALNTHRGITNRLIWMQAQYGLTTRDGVLQKTPFSFDVSVWELFWPLISGARLVCARPGGHRESDYLIDLIQQQSITTAHFVPSMLRAFLDTPEVERCKSLRRVICSGEALAPDLQEKFFARLPAGLHNLYGPTEAAVDVTFWECRRGDPQPNVPIGRPIANTRIYIVDEFLQPCPVGIPGELLIAGVAVGPGYYHEPELTAARFIRDPFSDDPTARVFRSGDLARYRADGNIEFLGRLDHQIKLRGLRVEPQEIEATLRRHPSVEDCVVIARQAPQTRLIAYIVGTSANGPALREFLRERLPEFMVPADFISLEKLPLLPNGKLDRQGLPEPVLTDTARARAPARNERERLLVEIWQDVLQLPQVGIHDNFFASGGDSILSIQIVARAGEAGIHLTTRQFFQRQTIAELAAAAETPAVRASSVSPLGAAPLSPIQRWFFEQELPNPAGFTQTTLLEVPHDIDPSRLAEAFAQVHAHHEALCLRFRPAGDGWIQEFTAHGNTQGIFAAQDLAPAQMVTAAEAARATLDITDGPLLAARLFRLGSTARLFIAVHHLAIDGVSWRILLEDLYNAYRGQRLPEKTTSLREWVLYLSSLSATAAILAEAPFWIGRLTRTIERIPFDYPCPRQSRTFSAPASVSFELPETETDILVRQLPGSYDARINELLLTALALAVQSATGQKNMLIDLESHGRHEADSGLDLSRTVGWFTGLYPALLELDTSLIPQALQSIKQQLRSIPQEGFGYPLLRYLCTDAVLRERLAALPAADILFNYHGRIDSSMSTSSSWRLAGEDITPVDLDYARCTHPIEIIAAVVDGKLRVDWRYSKQLFTATSSEVFARHFEHHLRALVYSRPHLARSYSAPAQYELAPLQLGILFHALYDHNPLVYLQQTSFTVAGKLDTAALRQSWTRAVQRHAVLRTAFQYEDLERPVRVIEPSVDLPWQTLDWSALDPQRRKQAYEEFLIRDRQRGFQLQQAPLLRCTLIREDSGLHHFCWSTHHILLDGWSSAVLLGEIFQEYISLARSGMPAAIAPPEHSYQDYVEWLGRRDRVADEFYWRSQLRGFRQPTPLPGESLAPGTGTEPEGENLEEALQLSEALTAQIQAHVRGHHLTLNVLLRGLWAILLARRSGNRDILFGVTVSGRAATLAGIESMVGLFINTLPLRLQLVPDATLVDWLRDIHAIQDHMEPHTHAALGDIQKWSDIPRGTALFQTQFVFQNFPVFEPKDDASRETGLEIRDVRSYTHSSYPLVLTAVPGAQLNLKLSYDQRRLTTDSIRSLLAELRALLESFANDPTQQCGKLLAVAEASPIARDFVTPAQTSPALAKVEPDAGLAVERVLLEIWESALGRQGIELTDDFFDLGGDSLVALRLMTRVGKTLNRRLPISVLVRNPTIEKLSAALREPPVPERSNGLVQIRGGCHAAPLFLLPGAGG